MEFLGKPVTSLFENFYEAHVAAHSSSVEVTFHEIPDGAPSIRGGRHLEFGFARVDRMLPGKAEVHVRTGVPAAVFEHALAHELLHVVSNVLRFPVPALKPGIPANSPEMGIVIDLITIECVANDRLLAPLGFDPGYIFQTRLQRLKQRVTETSGATDDLSRPWAVRTTLHYIRALLDSGPAAISQVPLSLGKLPRIRAIGDKLYSEIAPLDLQNHGQRLGALVSMRDALGLKGMVDIIEPGVRGGVR